MTVAPETCPGAGEVSAILTAVTFVACVALIAYLLFRTRIHKWLWRRKQSKQPKLTPKQRIDPKEIALWSQYRRDGRFME